jgi:hypothetical protein
METITIYGHMCEEQKNDIKQILTLADNLVECATSFTTSGGQGYQSFIQAKNQFENVVYETHKYYRKVSTGGCTNFLGPQEVHTLGKIR